MGVIFNNRLIDTLLDSKEQSIRIGGYTFYSGIFRKEMVTNCLDKMTFPSTKIIHEREDIKGDLGVTIVLSNAPQKLLGTAVYRAYGEKGVELLTFIIRKEIRGNGIGKLLLNQIEAVAHRDGKTELGLLAKTNWPLYPAWEHLLESGGWHFHRDQMVLYRLPDVISMQDKKWFKRARLPERFIIENFTPDTYDELVTLYEQMDGEIPPEIEEVSPLQHWDKTLYHASLLLKLNGEIVGWLHCHQLSPKAVQASALYVNQEKAKGLSMVLFAEVIKRRKLGYDIYFIVKPQNLTMQKFCNKLFLSEDQKSSVFYLKEWRKTLN